MYNKGDLKLRMRDLTNDEDYPEDGESRYLIDARTEGETEEYPMVFLPHSCDCWIIGGAENIRILIADLWQALQKIEPHTDYLVYGNPLKDLDYIYPQNISEGKYQHDDKLILSSKVQEQIKLLSKQATENLRESTNKLFQEQMNRKMAKVNEGISNAEGKLKELDEEEKLREEYS